MADRPIGSLPPAPQVLDTTLIPVEQNSIAMKMTGAQFKEFAKTSVRQYVDEAKAAAGAAEASKDAAKVSEDAAKASETAAKASETQSAQYAASAETAKTAAEAAQAAADTSKSQAASSAADALASKNAAALSESNASVSATSAASSAAAASLSATNAATSESNAATSETAATASKDASATSAAAAAASAQEAKDYSGKPPIIQNNHWWTWDATQQKYVDTGEVARGDVMYATFAVDPTTGELYMYTDDEYTGPTFRLVNGDLEVVLNGGN